MELRTSEIAWMHCLPLPGPLAGNSCADTVALAHSVYRSWKRAVSLSSVVLYYVAFNGVTYAAVV